MRIWLSIMIIGGAALMGFVGTANAGPASSCSLNIGQSGFTCNIYESNVDGFSSETSDIFNLPTLVTAGYIVLLEHPNSLQTDSTQWSDVLNLIDNGQGTATTGRLLSDPASFPTFALVNAAPHAFLLETQTGIGDDNTDFTTYFASPNTYNIYSASPINEGEPTTVPEPLTLSLFSAGLLGAAALRRRKSKQA